MAAKDSESFVDFFRSLPLRANEHATATSNVSSSNSLPFILRIFQRKNGEFYTVHGSDAVFIADQFFHTRDVIRYYGSANSSDENSTNNSNSNSRALGGLTLRPARVLTILRECMEDRQSDSLKRVQTAEIWARKQQQHGQGGSGEHWMILHKLSPGNTANLQSIAQGLHLAHHQPDITASVSLVAAVVVLRNRLAFNTSSSSWSTSSASSSSFSQSHRVFSIVVCDSVRSRFLVCDFLDSPPFLLLESCFIQYCLRECILCIDNFPQEEQRQLKGILQRLGVLVHDRQHANWVQTLDNNRKQIRKIIASTDRFHAALDKPETVGLIAELMDYLEIGNSHIPTSNTSAATYNIADLNVNAYMRLDASALAALSLFPNPADPLSLNSSFDSILSSTSASSSSLSSSSLPSSIFGLLNRCQTAMGSRLLNVWLRQPLIDVIQINRRLDMVDCIMCNGENRILLAEKYLKRVPDLDRLAWLFQKGAAGIRHVIQLYQTVIRLPKILQSLKGMQQLPLSSCPVSASTSAMTTSSSSSSSSSTQSSSLLTDSIECIAGLVCEFGNFERMVEHTIDLDALRSHRYVINPKIHSDLHSLADEQKSLLHAMEQLSSLACADLRLESGRVKLNIAPHLGHHFRVTRKDDKVLRTMKKYELLETRRDGVRFTSQKLRTLNEQYKKASNRYATIQDDLVKQMMEIIRTYLPAIRKMGEILAQLDVFVAFAQTAKLSPMTYVRPILASAAEDKLLDMRGMRHPILELDGYNSFVANDVQLNQERSIAIITGPNMGGKSTYIRSVGIIAILAQMGSFVPCSYCRFSVFDSVMCRVGAADQQIRGVSTFMKEMLDSSAIIHGATPASLVIIDELGRGTTVHEGFGLAFAICDYLATHAQPFTLFATHFHELTAITRQRSNVSNLHAVAQLQHQRLRMTFRIQPGICDRSFGIHVAKMAGFAEEILDIARYKTQQLECAQHTNTNVLPKQVIQEMQTQPQSLADVNRKRKRDGDAEAQGEGDRT